MLLTHSSFLSTHTLESFNSAVKTPSLESVPTQDVDDICTIKDILPGGPADIDVQGRRRNIGSRTR